MDCLAARLASRSLVKVILGITNFDVREARFLSTVYTLAGADVIDLPAEPAIVTAAKRAIADIRAQFPLLPAAPRLMVSVALAGDPHIRGARLDAEQRAAVAPADAAELTGAVEACLERGADMVEVHAADSDDAALRAAVEALDPVLGERYLSVCLGTQGLGAPADVIRQARIALEVHGPRTMIQAEGLTPTGRAHPSSSLQGLALAQALLAHTGAYVLVAGGANHWTRTLAEILDVPVHGVACGTYARALAQGLQAAESGTADWEEVAAVTGAFVRQLRGGAGRDR